MAAALATVVAGRRPPLKQAAEFWVSHDLITVSNADVLEKTIGFRKRLLPGWAKGTADMKLAKAEKKRENHVP